MKKEESNSSLGKRVATGAAWTISFRLADRFLGLISTVILARLLAPADFGLVAMAVTLIAMIEVVTVGEFGSAIIQNPSPTRDHYDSAWTLSAIFGVVAALFLVAAASPAAAFFKEPRLVPVILILSLLPLLDGVINMGIVDFRKELSFRKDFVFQASRRLIAFLITVPLAIIFHSYWALIAGMLGGKIAGLALSYALHPFRPRFSLKSAGSLFRFSRWLMLNNGLTFLSSRGAHIVIGRAIGSQGLGLYTVAHEFANLPTSELALPINRAVFPGYSKLQGDQEALQSGFLRVVGLIALVAIPAGLGMSAVAHMVVPVLLGTQWIAAIPLISILAIAGAIHVIQANVESLYYATGHPKYRAAMTMTEISIFLPLSYFLLTRHGLIGVAFAYLATVCIVVPINFSVALKLLKLPPSRLISVLWRPAVAASMMALTVKWAFGGGTGSSTAQDIGKLTAAVLLGVASYAVYVSALWAMSGRSDGAEAWLSTNAIAAFRKLRNGDQNA